MTRRCARCGIDREVNESRDVGLCRDCALVERDLSVCGSERGYQRHRHYKELACRPCLDAHAEKDRQDRRARGVGPRRAAVCGTPGGYTRHRRTLGEAACDACLAAHNAAQREWHHRRKEQAA